MEWYFSSGGRQFGPIDEARLRELARDGALKPSDHVWNPTMGDTWRRAGEIPDLFTAPPPLASTAPFSAPPLPGGISCTAPVSRAWEGMLGMLFRPFDIGKWFLLGFSAWLATLMESSGAGGPMNFADFNSLRDRERPLPVDVDAAIRQVIAFLRAHADVILTVGLAAIALSVVVGVLVLWVRCRGKFMFLDNVVRGEVEISLPWHAFRARGNSLFVWTLVYGLVCLLIGLLLLGLAIVSIGLPMLRARAFVPSVIPAIALAVFLWLVFALVTGFIGRVLEDVVIPIMYRRNLSASAAWRVALALLRVHFWRVVLYALFYWVLALGAGMLLAVAVLATCCCYLFLMAIPYIGAVAMLPATVFFRLYSVEYLAQFGPDFDAHVASPDEA